MNSSLPPTLSGFRLAFTGGGSAGHVVPLIPVIDAVKGYGADVLYIGSKSGIERAIVTGCGVDFKSVRTTKLHRSLRLQNFFMPVVLLGGIIDAYRTLREYKPALVVSKGGFVSVPVVIAAYALRIPIVCHESDLSFGLANRIAMPLCTYMCTALPLGMLRKHTSHKLVYTGVPLRKEFADVQSTKGHVSKSENRRPILLVFGGSLGSKIINETVRLSLPMLDGYDVIHICGKGNTVPALNRPGYVQLEYVQDGMADLLNSADVVLSRAGMTSILELLFLRKPAVLVPLTRSASRGDQIENADLFRSLNIFQVVEERNLETSLLESLTRARSSERTAKLAIEKLGLNFTLQPFLSVIFRLVGKSL